MKNKQKQSLIPIEEFTMKQRLLQALVNKKMKLGYVVSKRDVIEYYKLDWKAPNGKFSLTGINSVELSISFPSSVRE